MGLASVLPVNPHRRRRLIPHHRRRRILRRHRRIVVVILFVLVVVALPHRRHSAGLIRVLHRLSGIASATASPVGATTRRCPHVGFIVVALFLRRRRFLVVVVLEAVVVVLLSYVIARCWSSAPQWRLPAAEALIVDTR